MSARARVPGARARRLSGEVSRSVDVLAALAELSREEFAFSHPEEFAAIAAACAWQAGRALEGVCESLDGTRPGYFVEG